MAHALWQQNLSVSIDWAKFSQWTFNSLYLGLLTSVLAVGLALSLAFSQRVRPSAWHRWSTQAVGLGYAVPGVIVVVGLLLPIGWLQQAWPQSQAGYYQMVSDAVAKYMAINYD